MTSIITETFGRWTRITLNRPDRLNSFTDEMKEELLGAVSSCSDDGDCRAVLITGNGRGFCAGQDLEERKPMDGVEAPSFKNTLETFYNPLTLAIRNMEKPVICAVNGVAAGAGANLALACDIVIAVRSAKFVQAFTNIGLVPDTGGSWFLPRLVGDARARALVMLGLPVSAEEAANWGMIWQAVDDDKLEEISTSLAHRLADRPTLALARAKALLNNGVTHSLEKHLAEETEAQDFLGRSQDYAEGVNAFLNKRTPNFTGR